MRPTFIAAYKDGIANGMGLVFAVGFCLYFARREDVGGAAIGAGMILLCLWSIWLVQGKYKSYDKLVAELAKEKKE